MDYIIILNWDYIIRIKISFGNNQTTEIHFYKIFHFIIEWCNHKNDVEHITRYISLHNCDHPDFQNEHPLTFLNVFQHVAMQDEQDQKWILKMLYTES